MCQVKSRFDYRESQFEAKIRIRLLIYDMIMLVTFIYNIVFRKEPRGYFEY